MAQSAAELNKKLMALWPEFVGAVDVPLWVRIGAMSRRRFLSPCPDSPYPDAGRMANTLAASGVVVIDVPGKGEVRFTADDVDFVYRKLVANDVPGVERVSARERSGQSGTADSTADELPALAILTLFAPEAGWPGKSFQHDDAGTIVTEDHASSVEGWFATATVRSHSELLTLFRAIEHRPIYPVNGGAVRARTRITIRNALVTRETIDPDVPLLRRAAKPDPSKTAPGVTAAAKRLVMLDLDGASLDELLGAAPELRGVTMIRQYSASAGLKEKPERKAHYWIVNREPWSDAEWKAWAKHVNERAGQQIVDPGAFSVSQPWYTSSPRFGEGVSDPFKGRSRFDILWGDRAVADLPRIEPPQPRRFAITADQARQIARTARVTETDVRNARYGVRLVEPAEGERHNTLRDRVLPRLFDYIADPEQARSLAHEWNDGLPDPLPAREVDNLAEWVCHRRHEEGRPPGLRSEAGQRVLAETWAPPAEVDAEEARDRLRREVAAALVASHPTAIPAMAGIGKTYVAAAAIREQLQSGTIAKVEYYGPEHAQIDDFLRAVRDLPDVAHYRGRDDTNCGRSLRDHYEAGGASPDRAADLAAKHGELVREAGERGFPVALNACHPSACPLSPYRLGDSGDGSELTSRKLHWAGARCAYWSQFRDQPTKQLRAYSHQALTRPRDCGQGDGFDPEPIPDVMVIDESILAQMAGVEGLWESDLSSDNFFSRRRIPQAALALAAHKGTSTEAEIDQLWNALTEVDQFGRDVAGDLAAGCEPGGAWDPAHLDYLANTLQNLTDHAVIHWSRDRDARQRIIKTSRRPAQRRFIKLLRVIAEDRRRFGHVRRVRPVSGHDGGVIAKLLDRAELPRLREALDAGASVVFLDAEASKPVLDKACGGHEVHIVHVPSPRRDCEVIQVCDRRFAKKHLLAPGAHGEPALTDVGREAVTLAERHAGSIISYRDIRAQVSDGSAVAGKCARSRAGRLWSHFGYLRGMNDMQDADALAILGRQKLPEMDVLNMAQAVFWDDPELIERAHPLERPVHRVASDGSEATVPAQVWEDGRVQAVADILESGETRQALDRGRWIGRRGRVLLLTSEPLPGVRVDRFVTWGELETFDRLERIADHFGGVVPLSPTILVAAGFFERAKQAERWIAKNKPGAVGAKIGRWHRGEFRLEGTRGRGAAVLVASRRSELAHCEVSKRLAAAAGKPVAKLVMDVSETKP